MRVLRVRGLVSVALAAAILPLTVGCGDDEVTTATLEGTWVATSLTAPSQPAWGDGVQDDGLVITMTFNANNTYAFSVANDDPADPWICPGQASCSWSGTYATAGSTMTFDQGTVDETVATYSISGNTLTVTFNATAQITNPYRFVAQKN